MRWEMATMTGFLVLAALATVAGAACCGTITAAVASLPVLGMIGLFLRTLHAPKRQPVHRRNRYL